MGEGAEGGPGLGRSYGEEEDVDLSRRRIVRDVGVERGDGLTVGPEDPQSRFPQPRHVSGVGVDHDGGLAGPGQTGGHDATDRTRSDREHAYVSASWMTCLRAQSIPRASASSLER